eukprot:9495271-Pyramimonas_sp.AAC.1
MAMLPQVCLHGGSEARRPPSPKLTSDRRSNCTVDRVRRYPPAQYAPHFFRRRRRHQYDLRRRGVDLQTSYPPPPPQKGRGFRFGHRLRPQRLEPAASRAMKCSTRSAVSCHAASTYRPSGH